MRCLFVFCIIKQTAEGDDKNFSRICPRFINESNEDRQIIDLLEYGVPQKNIYVDKQSGKDFNRPEYIL